MEDELHITEANDLNNLKSLRHDKSALTTLIGALQQI